MVLFKVLQQTLIYHVLFFTLFNCHFYFLGEAAVLKRRERRIWEETRAKMLFEYQQFSYYGSSTAWLMFELAWKMSQVSFHLKIKKIVKSGTRL